MCVSIILLRGRKEVAGKRHLDQVVLSPGPLGGNVREKWWPQLLFPRGRGDGGGRGNRQVACGKFVDITDQLFLI